MSNKTNNLDIVPIIERQPWYVPAMIFGGLEFCIPVLLVGGILVGNFSLWETIIVLVIGLLGIQWIGNTIQGYIGAKTGLASTELASLSFGKDQSRVFVGTVILILTLGWWAVQTTVAADALCVLVGVSKEDSFMAYALITAVVGLLFAIPSILGYFSIKWVDYIAMPAGLVLVIVALYLSFSNLGWSTISSWQPNGNLSIIQGVSLIISVNVAQWLIAPDYTRYAQPTWKDNMLIPIGIIAVGFPLFLVGGIMSIGVGNADIVNVMVNLGFPTWGFIVLWIATWTSQLVSNYTGGLVLCSMLNKQGDKSRKAMTLLFALAGIVLALMGIMSQFENFLYLTALVVPVVAGVIMAHFFFVNKDVNQPIKNWNWVATSALVIGLVVGYFTQYVYPFGIPAVQSLLVSGLTYLALTRATY